MTPALDPCFYFISARGFDRIFTILSNLFGGFMEVANQVSESGFYTLCLRTKMRYTAEMLDLR